MVSTFGSLQTAYSGLAAARSGLDVTGQNIANAGTAGYTRQRIVQSSVGAPAQTGIVRGAAALAGQGVSVDAIARLASSTLDTRVRFSSGAAAYAATRATALDQLETGLHEPGADGLATKLDGLWSAFGDLATHIDDPGAASALIGAAKTVASTLASGSAAVDAQWTATRGTVGSQVVQVNDAASRVATLNASIRSTIAGGGSANDLLDQRDQLTTQIASLTGAGVRDNGDGTVDVVIGGNALVQGTSARSLALGGATTLSGTATDAPGLSWVGGAGGPVTLDGGSIAGGLSLLGPANAARSGGALAEASAAYDRVATDLATKVNAAHGAGTTPSGATGAPFFALTAGVPAAQGLTVVPTDASGLATRDATGRYDASALTASAAVGTGTGAPDATWATFVTGVGSASRTATSEATLTGLALTNAQTQQQSGAGVSLDEENVNLLAYQHAYQGAARVLTAVDEMLDTIINRLGLVGRS